VEGLYLGTFAFGVIFTLASFALGAFGGGHDIHLHGFDLHGAGDGLGDATGDAHDAHISPFSVSTISAFLAWFGGSGYLLTRFTRLAALLDLLLAAGVGLVGGSIIFVILGKYVLPRLTELRQEDFQVQGSVGHLSVSIAAGAVGEIVYTVGGAQQVDGARSVSGEAIERGTEVVVLRREKGIAYVERWDKFAAGNQLPPGEPGPAQ
jgi:membrane protein implicated in regulation of membrane protease activity